MKRWGVYIAWLLATFACLVSLYFSDMRHMTPCNLCWYQRICLYPLVILLAMGCWRGFFDIAVYTLPLVVIGLILSLYHIAIQEIPGWMPIDMCGSGPNCAERVALFGPITIPMLSAINFLAIGFLLFYAVASKSTKQNNTPN